MGVFKTVKGQVTARQAAEMYGLKVSRNGMACCPFHRDRIPSMKVDRGFYCFGCGARGDAVDLTAKLLCLKPREAAIRIADDFGIKTDKGGCRGTEQKSNKSVSLGPKEDSSEDAWKWFDFAVNTLTEYRWLLRSFEESDSPQSMDEDFDDHPLFCLALQQKSQIDYLLDELTGCSKDQLNEMKNNCEKEVAKIAERLSRYESGREEKDSSAADGRRCENGRGTS